MTRNIPLGLKIFGGVIGVLLIMPTLVVIPMSFSASPLLKFPPEGFSLHWYGVFFTDPLWSSAALRSIQIAALTTVLSLILGMATALAMIRGRFRGKSPIQVLILSPIIMPIVVLAVGLYFVYSDWKILGSVGGLVLAHTVIAYPLVYISLSTALKGLDSKLEDASASLGASKTYTFRRITLPLITPGLLTGALFAFTMSWDELILSIFLTGPTVKTLPVVMWDQVQTELSPTLAVAATIVMLVTIVLIMSALLIGTRRKALKP
ncbi:ABC transporter permease [Arthrobacter sp. NPDC093139]|uniref:ABC transporter permease n=1 Tax=Arthrobacter sp. NPDC093139 TaxID=3363945 RepID=UPI003821C9B9